MPDYNLQSAQVDNSDTGRLQINVTSTLGLIPIENATVTISYTGIPDVAIERLTTDSSGQTQTIDLPAPPFEYSQQPE